MTFLANSVFDFEAPGAIYFERNITKAPFVCEICRTGHAAFKQLVISKTDMIQFWMNCRDCGSNYMKSFSLEEIRMIMKAYSMGDSDLAHFWEIWFLVKHYSHLTPDFKKFLHFDNILARPASFLTLGREQAGSRYKDAMSRIWRLLGVR